jgi:hypothetical protein
MSEQTMLALLKESSLAHLIDYWSFSSTKLVVKAFFRCHIVSIS